MAKRKHSPEARTMIENYIDCYNNKRVQRNPGVRKFWHFLMFPQHRSAVQLHTKKLPAP